MWAARLRKFDDETAVQLLSIVPINNVKKHDDDLTYSHHRAF